MSITTFLEQPFPYFKKRWKVVALTTIWVFLVFAVFSPLGIGFLDYKIYITSYFTVAAFLSSYIPTYIFPLIFRKHYNPATWTKGKYFLYSLTITLFMILFTVLYYYLYLGLGLHWVKNPFENKLNIILISLLIATFPTLLFYLIGEKFTPDSTGSDTSEEVDETNSIELLGSTKDCLKIMPDNFLYAEVTKNYVTVYYFDKGKVASKSLRTTLANITESLQETPQIIRCHRAFIINTDNVVDISGNSHGYQLTLKDIKTPIPVSRQYTQILKSKLEF